MGGRGTHARTTIAEFQAAQSAPPRLGFELPDIERHYGISSHASLAPGASYPFAPTERAWTQTTVPAREVRSEEGGYELGVDLRDQLGREQPTLRWVKDGRVVDLFVDGMSAEDFLAATGLELDMSRQLPKRLSRILRPYYAAAHFDPADVTIQYMDQTPDEAKVWDGAGLISRAMMEKLVAELSPDLTPAKHAQLLRELKHGQRVEFTIMTERGQDKGHAIVSDTLAVDFLLPRDTKTDVRLVSGQTFVGVNFVHGRPDMRMDIQSLINLHPFFEPEQLAGWLADEGQLFAESIETGQVGAAMARIDRFTAIEDVQSWPLREYLASGGDPRWFRHHVKSFANQHLERLNHSTLEKVRMPIPGGRYYVMTEAVAHKAGLDHVQVGRGEIHIDPQTHSAWVNDQDWLQLEGASEGIAGILGGADHDDGLWLHPFTDHDDVRKVLAWRSPNQPGEYVMLKPTAHSDPLAWQAPDGEEVVYPYGDSRQLPTRVDRTNIVYPDPPADPLDLAGEYSVEAMTPFIERTLANEGALGSYCNLLMVSKAVYGEPPSRPQASLERIIDGTQKDQEDMGWVKDWTRAASETIVEQGQPVPAILRDRLNLPWDTKSQVAFTQDHWLDRLTAATQEHISLMESKRDEFVAEASPPRALFDSVLETEEGRQAAQIGARLNQTYSRAMRRLAKTRAERTGQAVAETRNAAQERGEQVSSFDQQRAHQQVEERLRAEDFDTARQETEAFLDRYPPQQHTAIARGAMLSAYTSDDPTVSDAMLWLAGEKTETGQRRGSIGQVSIRALREIGLLDEMMATDERGILVYPGAIVEEPLRRTVGINGVWFNWYRRWARDNGQPVPQKMGDVHKQQAKWAKEQIADLARSAFRKLRLHVRENERGRKVAYTPDGDLFGFISKNSAAEVGDEITLDLSITRDGNLRSLIAEAP